MAFAILAALALGTALPSPALAAAVTLPTIDLADVLPEKAASMLLETIGFWSMPRPYRGGSSIGKGNTGLGLEATLIHFPKGFWETLDEVPIDTEDQTLQSIPAARITLQRGLSDSFDFGVAGLYYQGNYMAGFDVKFTLSEPTEGIGWYLQGGYSRTHFDLSTFNMTIDLKVDGTDFGNVGLLVRTQSYMARLIASKKLQFARPYIAAGIDVTRGQIQVPIDMDLIDASSTLSTDVYSKTGFALDMGVDFRFDPFPLFLSLGGGYSSTGMHSLGLAVGLSL